MSSGDRAKLAATSPNFHEARIVVTPTEVIQYFCQRISWADRTRQAVVGGYAVLIDDTCLMLPCHWPNYEGDREAAVALAAAESRRPALIIWGDPEARVVESIWWDALTRGILTRWLDIDAKLCERRLIGRLTDGIDWQRTLPDVMAQGAAAKPTYLWDS